MRVVDGPTNIVTRRIPPYNLLDEEQLTLIEEQADWIGKEVGIEFRGDGAALELFRNAGASVSGERVTFDPGHLRRLCATAPTQFRMSGRTPKDDIILGGDHIVLMPGYGSPFVTDLEQGRRYATLQDFENFVKLSHASPHMHHSGGTVCEPVDIPVDKRHLEMVRAHLCLSTKPFMGGVTSELAAQESIHLTRIAFGERTLDSTIAIQANINVNSPLVYDDTMSSALRIYAAANQCVAVSPAVFGGVMGPLTQPAVLAQTLFEAMVGIALAQLVRPGCPTVLGSFHTTMNLKSGALTFGTPEANLANFGLAQLARRLGVPVRSGGGQITASPTADGHAMQESTAAMFSTVMSGAHQIWHAAGWLEGGLTMSYEKFVMDLDHCGMMLRMIQGLTFDQDTFGRDAYQEAGPGQNFLSTAHTMRLFRNANFQSDLPEPGAFEFWKNAGGLNSDQRATDRWKTMLADYQPPAMDEGIREALDDYIIRKKQSRPDQWY